jgi:hypothetical protein
MILAVRLEPLTVKLCWVAAVPAQAVKAVGVPVAVRVGEEAGAVTVRVNGTVVLTQPVVELRTVRLKL